MQYENRLKKSLLNAKENIEDIFFPRRGAYINVKHKGRKSHLLDLEPFYDDQKKIFFKYILDTNEFGFSSDQYYATSDTYFIWKKSPSLDVDYYLFLAYLNSNIVEFLFKAKNIKIKRSKTKLESNIPIPPFIFRTHIEEYDPHSIQLIHTIHDLSKLIVALIQKQNQKQKNLLNLRRKFKLVKKNLNNIDILKSEQLLENRALEMTVASLKGVINSLFFTLFGIKKKEINDLLKKYY
jgi:hypothetical protein